MPIAVGMYLPFGLSTPILAGGLLAHFITLKSSSKEKPGGLLQNGVLLSSGLIAGESLMGILLALLASAGIKSMNFVFQPDMITIFTFISAISVVWWLYKNSLVKR